MIVRVQNQYTFVRYHNKLYCITGNKKSVMSDTDRDYFSLVNRYRAYGFFGVSFLYDYTEEVLEFAKDFQGYVDRGLARCSRLQFAQLISELKTYEPVDWFHEDIPRVSSYFISFILRKRHHSDVSKFIKSTIQFLGAL